MSPDVGVSRRGFMKGVAGTAAMAGSAAGLASGSAQASFADVIVAATVVRTGFSRIDRRMMRIGVRASIRASDVDLDNVVVVIDRVPFNASAEEVRFRIASTVQERAAALLDQRGIAAEKGQIAVQVFGGVLG